MDNYGRVKTLEFTYQYLVTPIIVFLVGYLLLRFMGKKAVSEMSSFDLLAIIVLGTAISEPIVSQKLGIASWYSAAIAFIYLMTSYLALKTPFKSWITFSPTVLIKGGDIDEKGLHKAKLSVNALLGELRTKGQTRVQDIELAMMEETGQISVVPKAEVRPLQPSDLNIAVKPAFIPIPLIIDGVVIEHNVKYLNKSMEWVELQLSAHNVTDIKQVTLAAYNQQGTLDIDNNNPHNHDKGPANYKPGDDN
jgi:uncharacterized membrane protein YcaP (DUF421 family)